MQCICFFIVRHSIILFTGYKTNGVKLDVWYKIPTKDIERLYQDPRYPQHPDYTTDLSTFDYSAIGSNYGSRLSSVYQVLFHCLDFIVMVY